MNRKNVLLTTLALLALLLPAVAAGAVAHLPAAPAADLPFDPAQVARDARNQLQPLDQGLYNDNGYRRVTLAAWGVTLTPRGAAAGLGFRLLEARRGDTILYAAPPAGGGLPERQEDLRRAAYARGDGLLEVYESLDFAVEQTFVLGTPPTGTGDLVLVGALSTTLAPLAAGVLDDAARFPLPAGGELYYGPALARDAAGREILLPLRLERGQVCLVVPGDWLADATYPVVVDPLLGSEITVSSAANDQVSPAVATSDVTDDAYRYLVVWADYRNGHWDIYGQFVTASGGVDPDKLITIYSDDGDTEKNQQAPAIAYNPDDDYYLVVWQDDRNALMSGSDIYHCRVEWDGSPITSETATSTAQGDQVAPAVGVNLDAADDDDRYLATWSDYRSDADGDVYAQRVKSDGTLNGSAITVIAEDDGDLTPDVAWDTANDRFLVVWEDRETNTGWDIAGRTVDDDDGSTGSKISISSAAADQAAPAVAYNGEDGQFLVVWSDYRNSAWDIYGQRVSGGGSLVGSNFAVASGDGDQRYPDVVHDGNVAEYIVVWQEGNMIRMQQLSNVGDALASGSYSVGSVNDINTRGRPAVAYNWDTNQYLAVWQYMSAVSAYYDIHGYVLDNGIGLEGGAQPAVAYAADATRFLVVWEEVQYIHGRIFTNDGTLGSELTICGNTNNRARSFPAVGYDPYNDCFLVVWEDYRNNQWDIYGRPVSPADGALGTEFAIQTANNAQRRPALAYSGDVTGGRQFLVVWEDDDGTNPIAIDGALVDLNGPSVTQLSTIGTDATYDCVWPDVAANPNESTDRFLVVWEKQASPAQIDGRLLQPDGTLGSAVSGILAAANPAVDWGDQSSDYYLVVGRKSATPNQNYAYGAFVSPSGSVGSAFDVSGEAIRVPEAHYRTLAVAASAHANEFLVGWTSPPRARRVTYSGGAQGAAATLWDHWPYGSYQPAVAYGGGPSGPRYLAVWNAYTPGGGGPLTALYVFRPVP